MLPDELKSTSTSAAADALPIQLGSHQHHCSVCRPHHTQIDTVSLFRHLGNLAQAINLGKSQSRRLFEWFAFGRPHFGSCTDASASRGTASQKSESTFGQTCSRGSWSASSKATVRIPQPQAQSQSASSTCLVLQNGISHGILQSTSANVCRLGRAFKPN